jgi:hypothetical protein
LAILQEKNQMTEEQYADFRHQCFHDLMKLNELCNQEFSIGKWARWDYDLESATLTFSHEGMPKILADEQVIGTTSDEQRNWEWGWANVNLPLQSVYLTEKIRSFGQQEEAEQLTKKFLPDDEYLGWEMTAIAVRVLGGRGAYRCPVDDGFIYFAYLNVWYADGSGTAKACRP